MSKTVVNPKNLFKNASATAEIREWADLFMEFGVAKSDEQAMYFAIVQTMELGFRQYHAAMAVGRLAGEKLDPVNLESGEFHNLYNRLANRTLAGMPAQGRA